MARKDRYSVEERRIAAKFGFEDLKDLYRITWGDAVDKGHMSTAAAIRKLIEKQAQEEDHIIVWRTIFPEDRWFNKADRKLFNPEIPAHKLVQDYDANVKRMFQEQGDLNKAAVDIIHEYGMKAFHWGDGLFDNCAPPFIRYAGLVPFAREARLQAEKPSVCRTDRFGHPHYGVWEYRYAEARQFTIERLVEQIRTYDFDGMVLSTRSHSVPAIDGEQYGYNDVIDDELKKLTGISYKDAAFWRNPFAQETRRRILGQSVTIFLQDLRKVWPKDKKLYIGIPRTRYWGPPYGNIFIAWHNWIEQRLVDGLYVDEVSGKALYPAIAEDDYLNYLSDEEAGLDLNPYFYDLEHTYGPVCSEAGVNLCVYRDAKAVVAAVYGDQYRPRLETGRPEEAS